MPWARFEDDYLGNQKLATLSTAAIALDLAAIIYSARELRDGLLSLTDVETIAVLIHIRAWRRPAVELVRVNRWEPTEGGYTIHDYLEYQPSRAQILAQREDDRIRKRRGAQTTNARRIPAGVASDSENTPGAPVPGPGRSRSPVPDSLRESPEHPPTPLASEGGGILRRRSSFTLMDRNTSSARTPTANASGWPCHDPGAVHWRRRVLRGVWPNDSRARVA